MNNQEMQSIVEQLQKRQSWIIKNFEDFLDAWKTATEDMEFEGPKKIYILNEPYSTPYGDNNRRYFIRIGDYHLDYEDTIDDSEWIESSSYPEVTARLVRAIIRADLMGNIRKYFEELQSEIETYDFPVIQFAPENLK